MSLSINSNGRSGRRARLAVIDHGYTLLATILAMLMATSMMSCSSREGWAVVLWPPEGSALGYGAIVPVHFKSNITKTYAVGVPGTRANEELELWRAEVYPSKSKAKAAAAAYGELLPFFGVATRDGLLLREKPDNVSDQVFRLRLGQPVKFLSRVEGVAVETGGMKLDGQWYLALTDDGTTGYIFSNQLQPWNAATEAMPDFRVEAPATDASLSSLFDTTWRPDYFESMLASGMLDLAVYQPRFGFFADPMRRVLRVERTEFSKVYKYDAIERRDDGSYDIIPGGASFWFTKTGALIFKPAEADVAPAALAKAREERGEEAFVSYQFIRYDKDVQAIVAAEERRRMSRLADFVAAGERFESETDGVLIATKSARFTWAAYGALTPAIIPEGAGETGSMSMDLYLSPELAGSWHGAFTLRFDGGTRPAVSFAYRLDGDQLSLAWLPPGTTSNAIVTAPNGLTAAITMTRYR